MVSGFSADGSGIRVEGLGQVEGSRTLNSHLRHIAFTKLFFHHAMREWHLSSSDYPFRIFRDVLAYSGLGWLLLGPSFCNVMKHCRNLTHPY